MVTFEQLNVQNDKITELSNVLVQLIPDRSMCDNPVTEELFFRYVDHVKEHLDIEDKNLYANLLTHRDQSIQHTASLFLSGSGKLNAYSSNIFANGATTMSFESKATTISYKKLRTCFV